MWARVRLRYDAAMSDNEPRHCLVTGGSSGPEPHRGVLRILIVLVLLGLTVAFLARHSDAFRRLWRNRDKINDTLVPTDSEPPDEREDTGK